MNASADKAEAIRTRVVYVDRTEVVNAYLEAIRPFRSRHRSGVVLGADREALVDAFVAVAADWATANKISYEAFREVKVPAVVLRRAGISKWSSSRRRSHAMTCRMTSYSGHRYD